MNAVSLRIASLILICVAMRVSGIDEMELERQLLEHMENINYHSSVRPSLSYSTETSISRGNDSKEPAQHHSTLVRVKIIVDEIERIRESENDLIVNVKLIQTWFDERLITNQSFQFLSLAYFRSKIWMPDLYFYNTKSVLNSGKQQFLLWLYPNGRIVSTRQLRLNLYCRIYLWRYPLDTQRCQMILGSNGYPVQDIKLRWWHDIYQKNRNFKFRTTFDQEFVHPTSSISSNNSYKTATGHFSVLLMKLKFRRNFIYHIIYTFLPATLIVLVSWVSFYIDYKAVPARIPFCLLTLLSIMTQWSNMNSTLPKLSYLKSIDVWMFICLTFIIASLFEYAFVNQMAMNIEQNRLHKDIRTAVKTEFVHFTRSISKESRKSQKKRRFSFSPISNKLARASFSEIEDCESCLKDDKANTPKKPLFSPSDIDKISRYVFPFAFAIVNVIFWVALTYD